MLAERPLVMIVNKNIIKISLISLYIFLLRDGMKGANFVYSKAIEPLLKKYAVQIDMVHQKIQLTINEKYTRLMLLFNQRANNVLQQRMTRILHQFNARLTNNNLNVFNDPNSINENDNNNANLSNDQLSVNDNANLIV
eukprot:TRINITY_DN3479_c0_g1_i4.p1 TRINITY_DN3479_c0_g1~~TRINITY_DN3479_c0_g1_i4.p1  ORF type:complete len:139 (-),score=41.47 TRINITY_DN3479_c0_g1_i4:270-686(-)